MSVAAVALVGLVRAPRSDPWAFVAGVALALALSFTFGVLTFVLVGVGIGVMAGNGEGRHEAYEQVPGRLLVRRAFWR